MSDWTDRSPGNVGDPTVISYDARYLFDKLEVKLDSIVNRLDAKTDVLDKRVSELETWRHTREDHRLTSEKRFNAALLILGAVFTALFILATVLVPILVG